MNVLEQREAARKFVNKWKGKGYEKGDTQLFWIEILQDILGAKNVTDKIEFEKTVSINGHTKFIDAYIPETKTLIEQKGINVDLDKPQLGHNDMTPFEQAFEYNTYLPTKETANWIVICNFKEIRIYDMNISEKDREVIKISILELQTKYGLLDFLIKKEVDKISREMEVSMQAGELVGKIYDAFIKQYKNPKDEKSLKSLNMLCVRIVFCLYAEDAGIFGKKGMFHDYLNSFKVEGMRTGLINLFKVLDTPEKDRDPYLADDNQILAEFPYVNGGLFKDENIEIPPFTEEISNLILRKASDEFDWSEISPTIFGAVFESTLNPETRRSGGMHYTSIENIHKVIDPLFLNELKKEFEEIKKIAVFNNKKKRLLEFQKKLASLKFLDPACGSGNFLTETYLSIRRLENNILYEINKGQIVMNMDVQNPIQISINQFYGIEINDFAVTVAKTALWIAESQMLKETEDIIHIQIDFLPLKTNAYICEDNALRVDWNQVVPKEQLSYIMGNPPFVGQKLQTVEQKKDLELIFGKKYKGLKMLDYVAGWYKKAVDIMEGTLIKTAFVSTNSVCQGEAVSDLWKPIIEQGIHINFAYKTFIWDSEASSKANVHCVIIGFSFFNNKNCKFIIEGDNIKKVKNINGYLIDAPNVFVTRRGKSLWGAPNMTKGAQLIDGGGFMLDSESEKNDFLNKYPESEPYIYRYYNARDFINNNPARYCLYLENCSPSTIKKIKGIKERVEQVYEYRNSSKAKSTRVLANQPSKFFQSQIPKKQSIVIPVVSSQGRRYIPMDFMPNKVVYSNALFYIDNANIYEFGILQSNVHMAWVRTVAGRLKSDFRYSNDIVYNNFPWPNPTNDQKALIEKTAQRIIDVRAMYKECSLADLYDIQLMPSKLIEAHIKNDRAVMSAYGFDIKTTSESDCVGMLMEMYKNKSM